MLSEMRPIRIQSFNSWLWGCLGVIVCLSVLTCAGQLRDGGNCETLHTEINVAKPKHYDYNGRRVRLYCTGNISIRKCEGSCTSQVSPSVRQFPGFRKDCKCCRETDLVDRLVTLTSCYAGNQLVAGQSVSLYVKEPTDCRCYSCEM